MNEGKKYTATDIERYHSGALSAAERHALEKSALDDPFLADALEGYTFTKTPSAELAVLQQRLQLRIEKDNKRRGGFFMSTSWMKIAALIVLIAGGGWLMFGLFNENKTELATSKPVFKVPAVVTTETANDSAIVYKDAPQLTPAPVFEKEKEKESDEVALQKPTAANPSTSQSLQAPASVYRRAVPDSIITEEYTGRLTAPTSVPIEEAIAKKQNANAEEKSRRDLPVTDTLRNINVTLKRDESSLAEVVVLKQKNKPPQLSRKMTFVVDTLEPAEGWTNFDYYVMNNLKEPEELKIKKTPGEVELSFEVNKNGEPVNITVTKPLCEKCDEEAVRLLKEGPKWKKGKKKGKVKIKFPTAR